MFITVYKDTLYGHLVSHHQFNLQPLVDFSFNNQLDLIHPMRYQANEPVASLFVFGLIWRTSGFLPNVAKTANATSFDLCEHKPTNASSWRVRNR